MRKLWAWMALALLVAGVAPATGLQMQTYTSADGGFTVDFPAGQVVPSTSDVALQGTDKTTDYGFAVEVGADPDSVLYSVDYADYPPNYTSGAPQDVLAAARDSAVTGKTLVSDKAIELNGIPGREFKMSDDQFDCTIRKFLQGNRIYSMMVITNKGTTAAPAAQFLDSLKLQTVAGAASATGLPMQPYTSTDGRFTVQFPAGQVGEKTAVNPLQGNDKVTVHGIYVSVDIGADSDIYMVEYADYPSKYTKGDAQRALESSRDSFTSGKTLGTDTGIDLKGVPGREFTASDDQSNWDMQEFLKGHRLYSVLIITTKGRTAPLTSQFQNSFMIQ